MAKKPWIFPSDVKEYSNSIDVQNRTDQKLFYDITRAISYIIFKTNNKFEDDFEQIPPDVRMATILLAEAYAKQAIPQKDNGNIKSETFDDYSYTVETNSDLADLLDLGSLLEPYTINKHGKVTMNLRKL